MGWCVVWRVFPDFASFVIPALVRLGRWVTGASTTLLPDDGVRVSIGCGRSTTATRSAAVFTLIFGALCLVLRRPPLEMLGWALRRQIPVATLALSRRRLAVGNTLVSGRELGRRLVADDCSAAPAS